MLERDRHDTALRIADEETDKLLEASNDAHFAAMEARRVYEQANNDAYNHAYAMLEKGQHVR